MHYNLSCSVEMVLLKCIHKVVRITYLSVVFNWNQDPWVQSKFLVILCDYFPYLESIGWSSRARRTLLTAEDYIIRNFCCLWHCRVVGSASSVRTGRTQKFSYIVAVSRGKATRRSSDDLPVTLLCKVCTFDGQFARSYASLSNVRFRTQRVPNRGHPSSSSFM